MPDNNDMDRINNPIEMAIKMLEATQDSVFNSIIGPEKAKSDPMIMGQPLNPLIDQIVQSAKMEGMLKQEMQVSDVSAPPVPTDTPTPMPAPPPPGVPPAGGVQEQSPMDMDSLMGMFGGGMNKVNA